jgi:hypothetical protein
LTVIRRFDLVARVDPSHSFADGRLAAAGDRRQAARGGAGRRGRRKFAGEWPNRPPGHQTRRGLHQNEEEGARNSLRGSEPRKKRR